MFKKSLRFLALAPFLLLLSCSSGGGGDKFPEVITIKQGDAVAQALPTEIVVGENRFTYFVLDAEGVPVVDAKTSITFYDLTDGKETKKDTLDGLSLVPARDAGIQEQVVRIMPDGSRQIQYNVGEDVGLYAVETSFDRPGLWGAEVDVKGGTPKLDKKLIMMFNVIEKGTVPNIGDQAPPSDNLTAADVTDLTVIDTSPEPSADMHTMSVQDAVTSGKPSVILFAAPGYCTSRVCGPEYEIMKKLYGEYQGKDVNFVHVEFYSDPATPQKRPVAAANEWNLRTEPWFFVVDAQGKISARFEGPTSLKELEDALKTVTS
jgi:hypothetical protein